MIVAELIFPAHASAGDSTDRKCLMIACQVFDISDRTHLEYSFPTRLIAPLRYSPHLAGKDPPVNMTRMAIADLLQRFKVTRGRADSCANVGASPAAIAVDLDA